MLRSENSGVGNNLGEEYEKGPISNLYDYNEETQGEIRVIDGQTLTELITSEKGDITLATMAYRPYDYTGAALKIHEHLCNQANLGKEVNVYVDAGYTKYSPTKDLPILMGLLFYPHETLSKQRKITQAINELLKSGVEVTYLRDFLTRSIFPLCNVDHRKIALSNNKAVIFGFNIDSRLDPKDTIDSGVVMSNPKINWWLREQIENPNDNDVMSAGHLSLISRETRVKDSEAERIILDSIRGAVSNITFFGQFIPDGKVLEEMVEAMKRGVEVTIVTNSPYSTSQILYRGIRKIGIKRLKKRFSKEGLKILVPKDPEIFMHLKALITDPNNPFSCTAITGTDNMTNTLLQKLGTREIIVATKDPHLVGTIFNGINNITEKYGFEPV